MEWLIAIVVAVMLVLHAYAALSTRVAINKKVKPVVDALEDLVHIAVTAKVPRPGGDNEPD